MWPKPSKTGAPKQEEEEQKEVEKEEKTKEEKKEKQLLPQRTDANVSHIWICLNIEFDFQNWKGSKKNPYELMN